MLYSCFWFVFVEENVLKLFFKCILSVNVLANNILSDTCGFDLSFELSKDNVSDICSKASEYNQVLS